MTARPRLRTRPLPADPDAAFRARAERDRRAIARLVKALHQPVRWRQAAASLAEIERLAHKLAGAGGIFGFAALSEDAARLERLLERWRLRPPGELSARRIATFARRVDPVLAGLARVNARA